MKAEVYVVFAVDCCWRGYSALRPAGFFSKEAYAVGRADEKEVCTDLDATLKLARSALGGKLSWALHSSPGHRRFLYSSPFLDYWRDAELMGGEICIHPHEDIAGVGSRIRETAHVRAVTEDLLNVLTRAGLHPPAFRPGYFGRNDELATVLEALGLLVDYSAAPGRHDPFVGCEWRGAPRGGGLLSREDAAAYGPPREGSTAVFEIPLGWDGAGDELGENYLFNELSTLERLGSVYASLREKARSGGEPLFVHFLFHSSAMGKPPFPEQVARFADRVRAGAGAIVTGAEAREIYLGEIFPRGG